MLHNFKNFIAFSLLKHGLREFLLSCSCTVELSCLHSVSQALLFLVPCLLSPVCLRFAYEEKRFSNCVTEETRKVDTNCTVELLESVL